SHAALDLVEDQQDAVAVGYAAQLVEKLFWRNQVSAFPLHRFDYDGSNLLGWKNGAEERVLYSLGAFDRAGIDRLAVGTAVTIGVRDVMHAGQQREKVLPLSGAAASE